MILSASDYLQAFLPVEVNKDVKWVHLKGLMWIKHSVIWMVFSFLQLGQDNKSLTLTLMMSQFFLLNSLGHLLDRQAGLCRTILGALS